MGSEVSTGEWGGGGWCQQAAGQPTEALLEALSSSLLLLLLGGAAPLRDLGEVAAALRRDFTGLACESSYSSAKANRSLNLHGKSHRHQRGTISGHSESNVCG